MKLHFYSNETMRYKGIAKIAAPWHLLRQWREIAPQLSIEIVIGPSRREKEIREYRCERVGKDEPIPDRHRTILEVKDKLIYFDVQDYHTIGAKLHKVPGLFDFCIKFQYRDGCYDDVPFKVVPFTYFSPNGHEEFMKQRKVREQILRGKKFKHSVLWVGATAETGLQVRKAINKHLVKNTKRSKHGRYSMEEYFQSICESTVLASARGIGDFCHRDMECMSIGTPFFRKVFNNRTRNPLIPNVHYYTIGGDEIGIQKTLEHFCDYFEPDGELIQFSDEGWDRYRMIVDRGMQWYDQNASPEASLKLLLEILEENGV